MKTSKRAAPTPGDWQQSGSLIYAPGEGGGMVCELSEPRASTLVEHHPVELDSEAWDEAMANGALITQAPRMHALLRRVLSETDGLGSGLEALREEIRVVAGEAQE